MNRTLSTYTQEDLDQIAGVPDGDLIYVDMIGFEVPQFVDPRYDLIVPGQVKDGMRLEHHVPLAFRGPYRPSDLPDESLFLGETNEEGYAICIANRGTDGLPCRALASNRTQYCGRHGGQLHPADRKMTQLKDGILPDVVQGRKLTRAQRVEIGLINVDDLGDDEIRGQYIWNDDGRKVSSRKISDRIHREMVKEMMARTSDKLAKGLPEVLDTMLEMATDPIVEPADRIKASIWWAERVLGKNPDIVLHGKAETPNDQIFNQLQVTSREDYRRGIESSHPIIEGEVVALGDSGPIGGNSRSEFRDGHPDDGIIINDGPSQVSGTRTAHARTDDDDSYTGLDHIVAPGDFGDIDVVPSEDSAEVDSPKREDIASRRARLTEQRKLRDKAKNRRYAARAQGLVGVSDVPWQIEWKKCREGFSARLWLPDDQTEQVLGRIAQAESLEAAMTVTEA